MSETGTIIRLERELAEARAENARNAAGWAEAVKLLDAGRMHVENLERELESVGINSEGLLSEIKRLTGELAEARANFVHAHDVAERYAAELARTSGGRTMDNTTPQAPEEREGMWRFASDLDWQKLLRLLAERDALADNLEQAQSDLKSACLGRNRLTVEVADLGAGIERAAGDLARFAKYIVTRVERPKDHACRQCAPESEILVPGFVCVWHEAEVRAAPKPEDK